MHGGELATNHYIYIFNQNYKGEMDTTSCIRTSIWNTPHFHCWHNDCECQKFRFMKYLNALLDKKTELPGEVMNYIVKSIYHRDVSNMTIPEYYSHIAWNTVGKYLKRFFIHEYIKFPKICFTLHKIQKFCGNKQRWKLCGKYKFPQIFSKIKLGEIKVFYTVLGKRSVACY